MRRSSWITIGANTAPAPSAALRLSGSLTSLDHDPIRLNRILISSLLFKHDLFGKPVPTFPDHALVAETARRSAPGRRQRTIAALQNPAPRRSERRGRR